MDKRRREELDTFLELQRDFQNEKSSVTVYAIAMNWFRKWEQFVKNRDSPLPGPVENLPITIVRNGNRVLRPCKLFLHIHALKYTYFFGIFQRLIQLPTLHSFLLPFGTCSIHTMEEVQKS